MDVLKAKMILEGYDLDEVTDFFKGNLKLKLANLQPEHIQVLKAFYDIGIERRTITENGGLEGITDVRFSDIQSKVNIEIRIIEVCYNDLLRDGLIIMTHQQMLYHYITPLGIKLIRYILGS